MPILLLIAILVMGAGVYVHQQPVERPVGRVESSTDEITPSPWPTQSIEPTTPPSTPTSKPTSIPKSSDSVSTKKDETTWQYPNSRVKSSSEFTSQDDPKVITAWYEQKIISLGFSSKSFVKTSANDKILNKLVAAKNQQEISVEITKNPDESVATIKVVLDN